MIRPTELRHIARRRLADRHDPVDGDEQRHEPTAHDRAARARRQGDERGPRHGDAGPRGDESAAEVTAPATTDTTTTRPTAGARPPTYAANRGTVRDARAR